MAESKRKLCIFLCHASQDKPVVRELAQRLSAEGWIDAWLDEKKLLPGQDWRTKIEEAVETSDSVMICLSTNSVSKEGFVQKELRYAREIAFEKPDETIFLIPLRLDDCVVPRGLRFYQWADYFGEKQEETYTALLESLKLRYEQKLKLEEIEQARLEKERQEREAAEKIVREKAEQEVAERIVREKAEREAAEKVKREKAEREAAEKAARERAEREVAEKAAREKAERMAAEKAARKRAQREAAEKAKREKALRNLERETQKIVDDAKRQSRAIERWSKWRKFLIAVQSRLDLFFIDVRYYLPTIIFALIVIAGVAYLIFYAPKNFPNLYQIPTSTVTTAYTQAPVSTFAALPPSKTAQPSSTPRASYTFTPAPSIIVTSQPLSINWGGAQVHWSSQPISVDNAQQLKEMIGSRVGAGGNPYFQVNTANRIFVSPDSKLIIYGLGTVIYIRETEDFSVVGTLVHPHNVECFDVSSDGKLLASNSGYGELGIWRINDGSLVQDLSNQQPGDGCPRFSPDGSLLALEDSNGISIRRTTDWQLVKVLSAQSDSGAYYLSSTFSFSPDGTLLAGTVYHRNTYNIYMWNAKDWTLKYTLQNAGYSSVFSPDGSLLASVSYEGISLWRVVDGSLIKTLNNNSLPPLIPSSPIFFLPNGQVLVTPMHALKSDTDLFRLWRVSDGLPIRDVLINERLDALSVSSDGSVLVSISTKVGYFNSTDWHNNSPDIVFIRLWGISP